MRFLPYDVARIVSRYLPREDQGGVLVSDGFSVEASEDMHARYEENVGEPTYFRRPPPDMQELTAKEE